jgi:hypothetical protein
VIVPKMIASGVRVGDARKHRSAALRMLGSSSRSIARNAMASASAWHDALSSRAGGERFESQGSRGRVIQSHSAESPRNSTRKIRRGARDSSPKRKRLRVARMKSATSYSRRIASPFSSARRPLCHCILQGGGHGQHDAMGEPLASGARFWRGQFCPAPLPRRQDRWNHHCLLQGRAPPHREPVRRQGPSGAAQPLTAGGGSGMPRRPDSTMRAAMPPTRRPAP